MKKAIKYIFLMSLITLVSCNQDILDLNNPNVPTTATALKAKSISRLRTERDIEL